MCTPGIYRETSSTKSIPLNQRVLEKNERLAMRNRNWFEASSILAVNLVSSPGAGKTSLLERTIQDIGSELGISVIEGDQATDNDARRIRAAGARVVQINTGTGCHLDASMVWTGIERLEPDARSTLFIENVGNLVCPAMFDLGEQFKVVICSVTEGDDKPTKYPHIFRASELMIVSKIDLLPYVSFSMERCIRAALEVNPELKVISVSVTRGDGLSDWYSWLRTRELARNSITTNSDAIKRPASI